MGEEKKKIEVEVSFATSLKFWLAFLVVQIVAMIIAFTIMLIFYALIFQQLLKWFSQLVPPALTTFTTII